MHAPTAAVAPHVATVNSSQVVLTVEVSDAYGIQQPGSGSVLQKLVGTQLIPVTIYLTWSLKAGRGWNYVNLTPGLNVFVVTATNLQNQTSTDTAKITYEPPPAQTGPAYSQTDYSALHHNFFRPGEPCPGCSATLSYFTPAYQSLDVSRSLGVTYSSATASPMGYVMIGVRAGGTDTVRAYSLKLKDLTTSTNVAFTNGQQELFYQPTCCTNSSTTVVAAQFDAAAASMATGGRLMAATVTVFYSTAPGTVGTSRVDTIRVHINNQIDSPLGRGVSWANVPRLGWGTGQYSIAYGDGSVVGYDLISWNADSIWYKTPTGSSRRLTYQIASSQFRASDPDGSFMNFSYYGLLLAAGNRFGDTTKYAWDNQDRLISVTDPTGKKIGIGYSGTGAGSLRTITDSAGGRTSTFVFDSAFRLKQITTPDASTKAFTNATYDVKHRLTAVTSPLGAVTTYSYAGSGGGSVRSVTESAAGQGSALTGYSRPATDTLVPPVGMTTSLSNRWAPGPNATVVTAPTGIKQLVEVDRYGQAVHTAVTDLQGRTHESWTQRDTAGRPLVVLGSELDATYYGYSGADLATVRTGDLTRQFTYGAFGQVASVIVNGKVNATYTYSGAAATLASVTQDSTSITTFTWDSHGRMRSQTTPLGSTTSIGFESGGLKNVDSVTTSYGTTILTRDAMGRVIAQKAPITGIDSTWYNVLNAVTKSRDALGQVTQAGVKLDTVVTRDSVVDARNQKYLTLLDKRGRPVAIVDAKGARDSIGYDALGRVVKQWTRRGDTISFAYDSLNRVKQRATLGDTAVFIYDSRTNASGGPTNEWMVAANGASRDSTAFDPQGRVRATVSTRSGTTLTIESVYKDLASGRSQIVWKKNGIGVDTINIDYDSFNRLKYQGAPHGGPTRVTYAASGALDSILFPASGLALKHTFSPTNGRLTQLTPSLALANLMQLYTYDNAGRMRTRQVGPTAGSEARFLTYDSTSRLTSYADSSFVTYQDFVCYVEDWDGNCTSWGYVPRVEHLPVRSATYSYDGVGNRTDGGDTATGPANRRPSWRGYTLTYDAAGNLLTRHKANDSLALTWNALGQLTQAKRNGTVTTFKYDAYGRRVKKTTNGAITYYLLDGDVTLAELDAAFAPQRVYSYWPGTDQPHGVKVGANQYTYLSEEPGNVVGLVNSSGTVVASYQYDPWGADLGSWSNVAQPFRYTGRELDSETGLYYYRARYYDPGMGRFVSEDPIGLAGGINGYAYVENDPANLVDPSGLQSDARCPFGWRLVTYPDGSTHCERGEPFAQSLPEVFVDGGYDWRRSHGERTIGARNPWDVPVVKTPEDPEIDALMDAFEVRCRNAMLSLVSTAVQDIATLWTGAAAWNLASGAVRATGRMIVKRGATPARLARLAERRFARRAAAIGSVATLPSGLNMSLSIFGASMQADWEMGLEDWLSIVPGVASFVAIRSAKRACQ